MRVRIRGHEIENRKAVRGCVERNARAALEIVIQRCGIDAQAKWRETCYSRCFWIHYADLIREAIGHEKCVCNRIKGHVCGTLKIRNSSRNEARAQRDFFFFKQKTAYEVRT